MVRHGYERCTPCHVDPSGGGVLSAYGRAMADEVLRMRFPGETAPGADAAPSAEFLWGALKLPEPLLLQGDLRYARFSQKVESVPVVSRGIWMQADFAAAAVVEQLTLSASVGYADSGARDAALTRAPGKNLVSRYHWLGYAFLDGALTVRAGRMNLPFGLRVHEHTLWARRDTRTSIDSDQQYGVAASYQDDRLRAELMGIIGNFSLHPDNYRERGYAGYIDFYATPQLSAGASSLITYRELDPTTLKPTFRHVHGVFARYATPWQPLILMSEWDYLLESPRYAKRRQGVVGFAQADLEVFRGIHVLATAEAKTIGSRSHPLSWGAWLSYAWFFLPHADLRVDSIYQNVGSDGDDLSVLTFLLQGHVFL